MRHRVLALALPFLAACGVRESRAPKPAAAPSDSVATAVPAAVQKPSLSARVTVVFEDDIAPTRRPDRPGAPRSAPSQKPVLNEITATLARQLSQRGGIAWSATRQLQWSDFRAAPQPQGREAALSTTGQISGSACSGTQFQYGVIAGFIPAESWVKPDVAANPQQSGMALAHERLHFDITEIIARELRQKLATMPRPCDMTEADRDALGAESFEEEKRVQQRYDDETNHGLDLAAQNRWASWAGNSLRALQEFAAPIAAREN